MHTSRAFTLLEVMVVLAIIGGLMALVSLSGSDRQNEDQTYRSVQQVNALFSAYRQEAVFQNIDLGVTFTDEAMHVFMLQDIRMQEVRANKTVEELGAIAKNPWRPYVGSLKPEYQLADGVYVGLSIEGREVDLSTRTQKENDIKPVLLFLSSDEYTPFELLFRHAHDESFAITLSGDGFGMPLIQVERFED